MSKYLKYGILEDIDTVRRIPVGKFWNVDLLVTPLTWLSPFVFFGLHLLLHMLESHLSVTDRLYQALLFTIAVEIRPATRSDAKPEPIKGANMEHNPAMNRLKTGPPNERTRWT